jgi:hypothetical protein
MPIVRLTRPNGGFLSVNLTEKTVRTVERSSDDKITYIRLDNQDLLQVTETVEQVLSICEFYIYNFLNVWERDDAVVEFVGKARNAALRNKTIDKQFLVLVQTQYKTDR